MTADWSTWILTHRDGFFCKDGRGWYTSSTNRTYALAWPFPSTIRGALCTAAGHELEHLGAGQLSPDDWLSLKDGVELKAVVPLRRPLTAADWSMPHRMWPVPRDALYLDGQPHVVRLMPVPPPSGVSGIGRRQHSLLEILWPATAPRLTQPRTGAGVKPCDPPDWWAEDMFVAWLLGREVPCEEGQTLKGLAFQKRTDIRLAVDPETLAAREGALFSLDVVETLTRDHTWAMGVVGRLPEDATIRDPQPIRFGGKHRVAELEAAKPDLLELPTDLEQAFTTGIHQGIRLVLVSPAHFTAGWLPDGFSRQGDRVLGRLLGLEVVLRAAIVPRPQHVSGWDLAHRRPRRTRRLVPPGSVYYFTKASEEPFTADELRRLWMAQLGGDQADGFGCVVPGLWDPSVSTTNEQV